MPYRWRAVLRSARAFQIICQVYGFWPYRIVHQHIETTHFLRVYTFLAPIFFIGAMTISSKKILMNSVVQYNTDAGNLIQSMFSISCRMMFGSGYIVSFWYRKEIVNGLVPQVVRFFNHIKNRPQMAASANVAYLDLLFKLYFKNIFIPIFVILGENIKLDYYAPVARNHVVHKFFVILPFWIFSVLPNLFAYVLLGITYGYRRLNAEIEEVIQEQMRMQHFYFEQNESSAVIDEEVNKHNDTRRYSRMKIFCELSDQLDELAILHMELGRIAKIVNRIVSAYLFIWCWHRMTYLIAQLFFGYQVACTVVTKVQTVTKIESNEELSWEMVAFFLGAGMLILVDFYMLANICFQTETEVCPMMFYH